MLGAAAVRLPASPSFVHQDAADVTCALSPAVTLLDRTGAIEPTPVLRPPTRSPNALLHRLGGGMRLLFGIRTNLGALIVQINRQNPAKSVCKQRLGGFWYFCVHQNTNSSMGGFCP